jgi:heat shock protein HslJ
MRTTRFLIAGLAIMFVTAACGNDDVTPQSGSTTTPSSGLDLDGRTFLSTKVTENDAPKALVAGSRIRLSFADGLISVSAGCNTTGGGEYRVVDGALVTAAMAMTEMACVDPLMAQDDWMLAFLGKHPAITLDGDTLTLTTDTTEIEMLDREVTDPDRQLVGTEWVGTTIIDGGTASSVSEDEVVRLVFGADGKVAGKTGCNQGSAPYMVDGSTITFGAFMLTKMACDAGPAGVESHVLSVLDGDTEFSIEAGSLTIMNGDIGLGFSAVSAPQE